MDWVRSDRIRNVFSEQRRFTLISCSEIGSCQPLCRTYFATGSSLPIEFTAGSPGRHDRHSQAPNQLPLKRVCEPDRQELGQLLSLPLSTRYQDGSLSGGKRYKKIASNMAAMNVTSNQS